MKVWQTFGRLRLRFDQSIQRGRNFSSCFDQVYGDRNGYAFCEVTGDGVDTVGVWGSNPHAPTIFIELFRYFRPPFVEAFRIWQTLKNCLHTRFPLQKGFGRLQAAKVWTEGFLVNCATPPTRVLNVKSFHMYDWFNVMARDCELPENDAPGIARKSVKGFSFNCPS